METCLALLIHHGASVQFVNLFFRLRLNAEFPYQSEVAAIVDNLHKEVIIQQIRQHKVLRIFKTKL